MSEIFMTREETAKALRLSVRTVDTLIGQGELAIRRVGRRVLVPTDEIRRFAGGGSLDSNSDPALPNTPEVVARVTDAPTASDECDPRATEFALSTSDQTKIGLVFCTPDERSLIVWHGSNEPQASIEALLQNGARPLGFICLSDDKSAGKLKVFSSLLEEFVSDTDAAAAMSRICRDWMLQ